MSIAVQIDELKAWNKRVSDLRQRHESSAERLSLHYAALLLDTTSGDLDKALEVVRKAWEVRSNPRTRVQGATTDSHAPTGPNASPNSTDGVRLSNGDPAKACGGPISWETKPVGGVRHTLDARSPNGPASRPPNKSMVNAQTLKSLTLFDTTTFDGRPIGDIRRGELKGYARRGKLAQAILDFGEAPDDFKVRDILRVSDLRKILLEVGEVQ